ncbi:hypothetical protein GCM10008098_05680 [Rhodanobacter panaciterrae]|uniref:Uncharacterized protein n=1 Tax=Rhodanobacter panaciterrae TaxID=490572 RepID=A0ABQ2ZHY7_9GAMM|nr:hypothetical protein GCM10008098_05680 [Rhodanobacter panaciterrae]
MLPLIGRRFIGANFTADEQELSCRCAARVTFSCVAKRKVTKEKATPLGACRASMPGKSVSCGRAFRQHIPVLAKRNRPPADSRYAACRPQLTAAQGPRVERRAILARTRCARCAGKRIQRE